VTKHDICQHFGIGGGTFETWRHRKIIPPPYGGKTRQAFYGQAHIDAIQAHFDLRHHNVSTKEAVAFCLEAGITLPQYVAWREKSLREFRLGIA
jgi:hypothetical protein